MSDDALVDGYTAAAVALLQEGPAWDSFREPDGDGFKLLAAKADGFAAVHRHWDTFAAESLPWRARQTLAAREIEAGLPDTCTSGRSTTLPERQQAVGSKWSGVATPHTAAGFTALAASLGYVVQVDFQNPFRCGLSRCGIDPLNPYAAALTMRVRVLGPRKTRARCGISQLGIDPLLKIQRAEDLECIVRRHAYSHVTVIFIYEGA